MNQPEFQISGQVINAATQEGIYNLKVEAWDKDQKYNDLLGVALTDRNGQFQIFFDLSYFREFAPDLSPDIFFKVFKGRKFIKSTEDSVIWNAEAQTRVEIFVDMPETQREGKDFVSSQQVMNYANFLGKSDFKGFFRQSKNRVGQSTNFARDMIINTLTKMEFNPIRVKETGEEEVVGQDVEVAKQNLEARRISVNEVKEYQPTINRTSLKEISSLQSGLKEGQKVNLYEENGKVRYYSVVETEKDTKTETEMATKIDQQQQEISDLRKEIENAKENETKKDEQIVNFKNMLDSLQKEQKELRKMVNKKSDQ